MNMRPIIIAGNWKMNKTYDEAKKFFHEISDWGKNFPNHTQVLIFPPSLYLIDGIRICGQANIGIGAQNIYYEDFGAFTGEISAKMIKEAGATHSLIGHSERRHIFHESDRDVNLKLKSVVAHDLTAIICVGETAEEREAGKTEEVLERQLNEGFRDIPSKDMDKIVIAYEPVWAIGTGKTATPGIAEDAHRFIREWINRNYDTESGIIVPILYGGSVNVKNIKDLLLQPDIDGTLIGGASLKIDDFTKMIEIAEDIVS
jgi:triosephosphate isomerase